MRYVCIYLEDRTAGALGQKKANYFVCTAKSFELQMKASKTY